MSRKIKNPAQMSLIQPKPKPRGIVMLTKKPKRPNKGDLGDIDSIILT